VGARARDRDHVRDFAREVDAARRAKHWGYGKLASHVGVLADGRTFDAKQMSRLCQATVASLDALLVARLVEVLAPELDPPRAWHAAGLTPPWVTEEDYRRGFAASAQAVGTNRKKDPGEGAPAGRRRPWRLPVAA